MTAEACRVRIDLSYDGGGFSGWARQPGQRTVQQVLEDALSQVLRAGPPVQLPVRLTVAGRTDAGVHARGQVAHADLPAAAWLEAAPVIMRRLSRLLPPDVRVRRIDVAPNGFDARFSALSRRYSYRVCDDVSGPDPLRRHDTLWYRREVQVGPMNEAAGLLLGEHDFAAFCRRREGASTVRELLSLSWSRPEPAVAEATVVADAFCHSMVRALVGALLKVGEGARPPSWPAQVLLARVRDSAAPVVPPHGLSLEEVCYPPADQLAQRALATRRVRPVPAEPVPAEPATGEPATGEPATGEPATGEPATGEPATGEPATGEPATGEPASGEPARLRGLRLPEHHPARQADTGGTGHQLA